MSYIRVATGKGGSAKGYVWTGDHWDKDKTKAKVYETYEKAHPESLWGVKEGNIEIVDLNAEQKEQQMTHEADLKLDAIKKLLDMHTAEEPKYEWQPLDTAPVDGTQILAAFGEDHWLVEIVKFVEGKWVKAWDHKDVIVDPEIDDEIYFKDALWMPVPEMPKKES